MSSLRAKSLHPAFACLEGLWADIDGWCWLSAFTKWCTKSKNPWCIRVHVYTCRRNIFAYWLLGWSSLCLGKTWHRKIMASQATMTPPRTSPPLASYCLAENPQSLLMKMFPSTSSQRLTLTLFCGWTTQRCCFEWLLIFFVDHRCLPQTFPAPQIRNLFSFWSGVSLNLSRLDPRPSEWKIGETQGT